MTYAPMDLTSDPERVPMRDDEPKWIPSKESLDPSRPGPAERPRELGRIVRGR